MDPFAVMTVRKLQSMDVLKFQSAEADWNTK